MRAFLVIFICVLFEFIATDPFNGYGEFPQSRAVMFGRFDGQPFNGRNIPQSMTFASGDTIATNSFAGGYNFPQYGAEETTEKRKTMQKHDNPSILIENPDSFSLSEEEETVKRIPGKNKPPRPQNNRDEDEEDDDLSSSWPLQGNRNGVPSFNSFFPIMIGRSGSKAKSSNDENGYPGSATAIANSFSTGKGGVATSHATSYGDPYLGTLLRNGKFNFNSRKYGQ